MITWQRHVGDDEKVHQGLCLIGALSLSLTEASSEESPSGKTVVLWLAGVPS